jgi:hypothetical protein
MTMRSQRAADATSSASGLRGLAAAFDGTKRQPPQAPQQVPSLALAARCA